MTHTQGIFTILLKIPNSLRNSCNFLIEELFKLEKLKKNILIVHDTKADHGFN